MITVIITQSGTRYTIRNGWLTDGKADYKFHCRLDPAGIPRFDQDIQVGDLMALLPDNSTLVTSPVVAILTEKSGAFAPERKKEVRQCLTRFEFSSVTAVNV